LISKLSAGAVKQKEGRSKEILTLLRQRKEANVLLVYAFIYNPYKIGKIRIHQTEKSA